MSELLTDIELREAIRNIQGYKTNVDGTVSADYDLIQSNRKQTEALVALIESQKHAYADFVIGADVTVPTGPRALGKTWAVVGNRIRAEQREHNR